MSARVLLSVRVRMLLLPPIRAQTLLLAPMQLRTSVRVLSPARKVPVVA
jgi:hypothetical protein